MSKFIASSTENSNSTSSVPITWHLPGTRQYPHHLPAIIFISSPPLSSSHPHHYPHHLPASILITSPPLSSSPPRHHLNHLPANIFISSPPLFSSPTPYPPVSSSHPRQYPHHLPASFLITYPVPASILITDPVPASILISHHLYSPLSLITSAPAFLDRFITQLHNLAIYTQQLQVNY